MICSVLTGKHKPTIVLASVLLLLAQLAAVNGFCQYNTGQNKVWVFGDSIGMNFNASTPTTFVSAMRTLEGSASVSSAEGNLLFYTNGKHVWNRLGDTMPHGRNIAPFYTFSTSQASVIVPKLGDPERYYVFSQENWDASGFGNRLCYSVVDMALNSGLGDVDTAQTAVPVASSLTEYMISVPGNNCNIWLLVHDRYAPRFFAYEITAAGINPTPVVSTVGFYPDWYSSGVLKVSHDRRKLACMSYSFSLTTAPSRAELYDFDPTTGVVSNCAVLSTHGGSYGAEFSPDNSKLYTFSSFDLAIYQYDLSLSDISAIAASEYTVASYPMVFFPPAIPGLQGGDLRLGPDKKIYFNGTVGHIDCIKAPDSAGSACHYASDVITIAPRLNKWGMPNLYWSTIAPPVTGNTRICVGGTSTLSSPATGGTWSCSNTAVAGIDPTSGNLLGISEGTATVNYTASCGSTAVTVSVVPNPAGIICDSTICIGQSVPASVATLGGTWGSGSEDVASIGPTSGIITGISSGSVVISYTLGTGCYAVRTLNIRPCTDVVSSIDKKPGFLITPNPARDMLSIFSDAADIRSITITDLAGKVLVSLRFNDVTRTNVNIAHLPAGTYIVRINGLHIRHLTKE